MKYKLLRLTLLSVLCVLFGGGIYAITNALMAAQQDEPEVTLDFTSQSNWNIPTSGTNKDLASFTNSDETCSIKLYATTNYKLNNGYLILGKKDSYLELPAFNFDVEKIEVTGTSGASTAVKQNIYVGDDAVSAETTGASADGSAITNTYEIASDYQAAGNIYKLVVTSSHNTQISYIKVYKKSESTDNRTATTVTFAEGYATSGAVGTQIDLPTATVSAGETVLEATVDWSSGNETVAEIVNNKVSLKAAGTAVITASFAGDNSNKPSSKSYTVKAYESYTSLSALQEAVNATNTPVQITFNNVYVTAVKGSNAYIADADGYGALIYTSNHGLTAGSILNGTIVASFELYKGATEIKDFSSTGLTITSGEYTPIVKTIDALSTANQSAVVTLKNVTYNDTDKTFSDGTNTIKYYDNFGASPTLEDGKAYDVTGVVVLFTSNNNVILEICPRTADDIVAAAAEPAGFRDIVLDLTAHPELLTEAPVYITVAEDGSIGTTDNAENAAATIKGKVHSSYGSSNFTASVPVQGCVKITYATHDYGNDISVTNSEGAEVAKFNTQGAKWMSDHNNVVVAYYRTNAPTTLNFSNASYNPYFAVEAIAEADLPAEVTKYNITFAAGEGVTGTAPAALEVEAGGKFTAPKNYTLYKEGYTLNGWESGDAIYLPGQEVTPEADMTLTAHFVENEVSLADRTEAVTITYELSGYNDNPKYNYQSGAGIIVTQATVNGKTIDVKSDTNGKFAHNGNGWHQVNAGTKVTVPSCNGATFNVQTYQNANALKFGDTAAEAGADPATYTATATDETLVIEQTGNGYWNKLEITLPVTESKYYVVGNMTGWGPKAEYKMTRNTAAEGEEYMIKLNLKTTDMFKVAKSEDGTTIKDSDWFPAGMGNSYGEHGEITADGQYTIYFRPSADGGDGWFNNYIKVTPTSDEPAELKDVTATWDFAANCANLAKKGTEGSSYTGETMASNVEGISMNIVYNGGQIKNNDNSYQVSNGVEMQIPVKNVGDLVVVRGYTNYSHYYIGNSTEELNDESSYKAKKSDVDAGYVAVTSCNNNNYYYSISVTQYAPTTEPVLVEKSIYKTDFSEWETFKASTTDPVVVNKTTKYTNENLDFSVFNTALMTTEDSKFSNYTTLPHNTLRAEKAADPYVTTSALGNITKVRFIHGATGGSRGWKLEAKGDGDEDWVVISDSYADPSSWCEVTKDINKNNCQLRFTNLNSKQNAYLFELEIFGKVDLSGAPLLETMTANGKTYNADDIFEMGNSGNYEATIELFSSETMPSAENPVTAVAANGEVGTITYTTEEANTIVTIPVTADEKTANYVATFIRKPMLTLTYIGVDGETELGTQQVEKDAELGEFAVDIESVSSLRNGYKARGWFKQNYVGEKYTTKSTFTENANLYAVETEIEVASTSRKYEFNLTDKNFYAEDHEAFNPSGDGFYWHDATHGWAFKNGNKIDLLVGPKAIISVARCQYGADGSKIYVKNAAGETLDTQDGKADACGGLMTYTHEGESGTLTLEFETTGETYIHSVKIANVAETNYEQDGQWLFVKAGDVSSFIDALEIANGTSGDDRLFIFLPNGTYDLGTAVQTPISRNNLSLIGESMEGVIIKNAPPTSKEGLMSASTIHNTGNNLYMQDLTLQNDLDYYSAGSAGRANAFHDGGDKTIAKNVKLMSYQDTYLTPANKQTYWETSEIHGAVDFICGGGDVFFEKCDLVTESRKKGEKNGEATITAHQPQTAEKFGYVFNNCTIENQAAKFNFGRAWGGASGATVRPTVTYLNTTLNQPTEIIATRFITTAMNNQSGVFHEYNSIDKDGNVVSPASNVQTFTDKSGGDAQEYETILTAEQAAGYALDKVFTDWKPADYTLQVEAPNAELKDGAISWTPADNGAIAYAIFKNGELLGITTGTTFVVEPVAERTASRAADADKYTIRAANPRGGFGEAKEVKDTATGINAVKNGQDADAIYNLQGVRVNNVQKGVYIVNGRKVVIK